MLIIDHEEDVGWWVLADDKDRSQFFMWMNETQSPFFMGLCANEKTAKNVVREYEVWKANA